MISLFDDERIMRTALKSNRHEAGWETAGSKKVRLCDSMADSELWAQVYFNIVHSIFLYAILTYRMLKANFYVIRIIFAVIPSPLEIRLILHFQK